MASAVVTDGLTKDFPVGFWRTRPHRALDRLSVDIPVGSVFGLLGPNGAGKSTTLKLLLNLIWPTAGRAQVLGRSPASPEARHRIGFLPEHPAFYEHLTAEELVTYFAGLSGHPRAEAARRARTALDRVGLSAERRRPLRQCSKGTLQRVGLAQALVTDPELIILDEPMSGLDPIGRREVREMILRLRDEGRTVLFSSHILSDAEQLCSRVIILSEGRLLASGGVDELVAGGTSRGWEIVVNDLVPEVADRVARRVRQVGSIDDRRCRLELSPHDRPEALVGELAAAGARLVSVAPLRATLEDVFVGLLDAESRSTVLERSPARIAC